MKKPVLLPLLLIAVFSCLSACPVTASKIVDISGIAVNVNATVTYFKSVDSYWNKDESAPDIDGISEDPPALQVIIALFDTASYDTLLSASGDEKKLLANMQTYTQNSTAFGVAAVEGSSLGTPANNGTWIKLPYSGGSAKLTLYDSSYEYFTGSGYYKVVAAFALPDFTTNVNGKAQPPILQAWVSPETMEDWQTIIWGDDTSGWKMVETQQKQ